MKWISVKDRLPHDGMFEKTYKDNVLVYRPNSVSKKIDVETTFSSYWFSDNRTTNEITHWQPLPEPPEEE
jgi:hypothetical protein